MSALLPGLGAARILRCLQDAVLESSSMTSILLVDDNEDLRELYGGLLRREGYVVREAENGKQALALLEYMESEPCLLLLDLMMPVMSGADLLKVLRDSGRLAKQPVIVLSAGSRPADVPEGQLVIRKPVDPRVLISLVRGFCDSDTRLA
jgi:CheY-like chemotaxis protein